MGMLLLVVVVMLFLVVLAGGLARRDVGQEHAAQRQKERLAVWDSYHAPRREPVTYTSWDNSPEPTQAELAAQEQRYRASCERAQAWHAQQERERAETAARNAQERADRRARADDLRAKQGDWHNKLNGGEAEIGRATWL